MHNEDMDIGIGGDAPLLYNVNTNVNTNVYSAVDDNMNTDDATIDILADDDDNNNTIVDDMDTDIIVDAVHVYIHFFLTESYIYMDATRRGKGNPPRPGSLTV